MKKPIKRRSRDKMRPEYDFTSMSGGIRGKHYEEYKTSFLEAVEQGRKSARRGDLLEHDEVVERIEKIFRS